MKRRISNPDAAAREKVTLQRIAQAAGVSLATASRVLNKTGLVTPEMERRVRAAASQLLAGTPRDKRRYTVCFLLANRPMLHPFHAYVLMGAHMSAAEQNHLILFYPFAYGATAAADEIRLPLLFDNRGSVDGFIMGGLNSPNLLELLARTGVPFAVLGNNVLGEWDPTGCDVVWMDDLTGSHELTRYLLDMGHRAIWYLGNRRYPTRRQQEGYTRAMREAGLEPRVLESDLENERDGGYLVAKSLFQSGQPVTAVCARSDTMAHGVYDAARAHGLRIPEDLSVAGFGDWPESQALTPTLTTVWSFPDQVGRRLAEMVARRIENRAVPPESVVVPMRLIERNSCARPTESAAKAAGAVSTP